VANYPTSVLSESLNTANTMIEGADMEADYRLDMSQIEPSLPGTFNFRLLANYQPVNRSQTFPGAAITRSIISRGHITAFVNYDIGDWNFGLQNRWISNFKQASQPTIIYAQPYIRSQDYVDLNITRNFTVDSATYSAYITVQNLFNSLAPLDATTSGAPGIYYPVPGGQGGGTGADIMGRYFTIGIRASL